MFTEAGRGNDVVMNENAKIQHAEVRHIASKRTVRDHFVDLIERHAEDYAVEGKRLLRRLVRVVTITGITLVVLCGSLIALVLHAMIK